MQKSLLAASSAVAVLASIPDDEYGQAFRQFETTHHKVYENEEERFGRFNIFKGNYMYIAAENAKGTNKYELGVNDFTDMTNEEFAATHFGYIKGSQRFGQVKNLGVHEYKGEALPTSVDWRDQGAVTKVKNQQHCGSCWAFSTVGAMEGAWKIASGNLVSLSEEQLVACSKQNHGCQGGSMELGFTYEEGTKVCTEQSYPYTSGGGSVGACQASSCTAGIPQGGITGYKTVASGTNDLMSALAQQPVSIAVEADKPIFQSYRSGVMTGGCGTNLDHGILAIGYGTESGTDYWLVKNSWGTVWGESGYGKLERGKGGTGECGILSDDSYPVASGSPRKHGLRQPQAKIGCLDDGACALDTRDCCSGKFHETIKCGGAVLSKRCGCVQEGDCALKEEDCCSSSWHTTLKCGAGLAGGRCDGSGNRNQTSVTV